MKAKKEIKECLESQIERQEDNECKDEGWDKDMAIMLRAKIEILLWVLDQLDQDNN